MYKKALLCIGGLMLAAGGPISLFSASDAAKGIKHGWTGGAAATTASQPQPGVPTASIPDPTPAIAPSPAISANREPLTTPTLAEVLRFDVTVEWVLQRWPRVSTGLPYLQLRGYRVPLVTGTSVGDVAGSLTYYFNAAQQLERITLQGSSGDPSMLVGLLVNQHRFARRLTNDPGLVLYESVDSANKPAGSLKIRSAHIVQASQPLNRYAVELVIDRPR